MGISNLFRGIAKYNQTLYGVYQAAIENPPTCYGILFACVDRRVHPSKFLQMHLGEQWVVRSPANILPHVNDTRE